MTFTNVVSKPFVPDKKVFPVRWLIVVFACVSVFMFSVLLLMLLEEKKTKTA